MIQSLKDLFSEARYLSRVFKQFRPINQAGRCIFCTAHIFDPETVEPRLRKEMEPFLPTRCSTEEDKKKHYSHCDFIRAQKFFSEVGDDTR